MAGKETQCYSPDLISKAAGMNRLKKMNTRKGEFHVNPKKKVRLPMMSINLSLKLVKNYEEMGFNVVEIPLQVQNKLTHLLIIL